MSDLDDQLSNLFGVKPSEIKTEIVEIKKDVRDITIPEGRKILSDESLYEDVQKVQQAIHKIMGVGVEAIEEAARTAKTSQDPDAYAALAGLIKSMTDLNLSMIDLRERTIGLEQNRAVEQEDTVKTGDMIQNNVFIGSTADMIEALRSKVGGRGLEAAASVITVEKDEAGLHTGKTEIGRETSLVSED